MGEIILSMDKLDVPTAQPVDYSYPISPRDDSCCAVNLNCDLPRGGNYKNHLFFKRSNPDLNPNPQAAVWDVCAPAPPEPMQSLTLLIPAERE